MTVAAWRVGTDGSVSYSGNAELPMKIFSPFAGFLSVVAAFLLILLFVGVVSETGEHQPLFQGIEPLYIHSTSV